MLTDLVRAYNGILVSLDSLCMLDKLVHKRRIIGLQKISNKTIPTPVENMSDDLYKFTILNQDFDSIYNFQAFLIQAKFKHLGFPLIRESSI